MADFHNLTAAHLSTGEVCTDVVKLLEDALDKAKRGEIIGVAIGAVEGNNGYLTNFASGCADKNIMMLAVHSLHTRITQGWYHSERESSNG